MKAKIIAPVLAATLSGAALMGAAVPASAAPAPTAQQAATQAPKLNAGQVTGTATDGSTFSGTLNLTNFVVQNGQLVAVGTLSGTLTDTAGNVLGTVSNLPVTLPVLGGTAGGACDILHLDLGPLDLNLLGLQVHLNEVVLDITAQPGPGNLLGNLLCSVAGLLDNGTGLNGLANLLNHLLGL
ncbi:ABC transporter substrate-binding protein [Sinomonas atrocyanea]|uniref:ABC transporter substrate-binding protein n=1 Tax=Sinomonas atrocyanea TaxID=37927 RepID=UPI003D96062D